MAAAIAASNPRNPPMTRMMTTARPAAHAGPSGSTNARQTARLAMTPAIAARAMVITGSWAEAYFGLRRSLPCGKSSTGRREPARAPWGSKRKSGSWRSLDVMIPLYVLALRRGARRRVHEGQLTGDQVPEADGRGDGQDAEDPGARQRASRPAAAE